ncbi:ATP-binding protein [Methanocella sp. MCL-LM]|uniref:ATP-binding protein n=1 Tax=Methanocella sp. MCL-LM TaxID=3412035 RepID=UPI003C78F2C5
MSEYKIGKVIGVSGDKIDIQVLNFSSEDGKITGVPDSMCINVDTENGPQPLLIGQPGSFIIISLTMGKLLSMIVDIQMKEFIPRTKKLDMDDGIPIESSIRTISAIPIGTIDSSGRFDRGTDILPTVNSDVFAVLNQTLDGVYESYAEGNFSIGKLSLVPAQDAKINLDAFLTRHAAILGQTGGGKSWTVASILQKIAQFPDSTIILFDLHGEYKNSFGDYADYIDASELELPYWLMNSEELLGLMVDRTEFAAPNQIAKFKELLQKAKETHEENKSLGISKITIDTPVFFNFNGIINEFRRLDVEMVQGVKGEKKGPLNGEFTKLLMRIDSRLNDKRYDLIFHPIKFNTSASMETLFRKIMGKENGRIKKVVIIDLSYVPYDVRNSVLSLIMRCLFDFAYWYKRINQKSYPIAIFCDEAHIYLNDNDPSTEAVRKSAERISKEGRKYGISLTVMSQRPREVSSTILSQCNTFLCLRITNPDDQIYVKNLLPDSIQGIVNIFPILRRGECILLGDSVIMPTRIKIDPPEPKPCSDDTSFYRIWASGYTEVDFKQVLSAWRKQEI